MLTRDEQIAAAAASSWMRASAIRPQAQPLETSALCPHGFVLAETPADRAQKTA